VTELITPDKKFLVVQSNSFINASYSLTLSEKRIILFMISQIQRTDEDFKSYRMSIKDFVDNLGTEAKNGYERIKYHLKRLMGRVLEIKDADRTLLVHFLSSADYHDGQGFVELRFDPSLKPFLLQLKECFTAYGLENVLPLQSVHSIRMYELLKQYENIGERTISLSELKYSLGLQDKYVGEYNAFKKRVLLQAQEDLEKNTDITFTFDEIKQGKKVAKIKFYINRKTKLFSEASKANPELVNELVDLGIEKFQAIKFVQAKDTAFLRESVDYAKKQFSVNKIHTNLGGYLKSLIEKEITITTNYEKRVQSELEEKAKQLAEERTQIQSLKQEYQEQRKRKIDELFVQMSEQERKAFFDSRNNIEKMMIFDEKGNLKENIANGLLRAHLAKENGLEETDVAFKLWVKENKEIELAQQLREGDLEWVVLNERLKFV
jgi:plasmid replication initiation protein